VFLRLQEVGPSYVPRKVAAAFNPRFRMPSYRCNNHRIMNHRSVTTCGAITTERKEPSMLSARNQFKGIVKSIKLGNVMAEVIVSASEIEIVSLVSRTSAEQLGL
jgi:ABC-type molybdate transport system ATPase subunit